MNKIHIYNIEQLLKDKCWKISSYILSQYDFQKLGHPLQEHWCIFENQFKKSFENNFFKEFLELAVLIRAFLDTHEIKIPKKIGTVSINVGSLIANNSNTKELTLREACNKTTGVST